MARNRYLKKLFNISEKYLDALYDASTHVNAQRRLEKGFGLPSEAAALVRNVSSSLKRRKTSEMQRRKQLKQLLAAMLGAAAVGTAGGYVLTKRKRNN